MHLEASCKIYTTSFNFQFEFHWPRNLNDLLEFFNLVHNLLPFNERKDLDTRKNFASLGTVCRNEPRIERLVKFTSVDLTRPIE